MEQVRLFDNSILMSVPAIHYRAIFAREVNILCMQEATRPEAIAVELGPHMVDALVLWMKELGMGSAGEKMLPCMLGMLADNRLIHPEYSDTALFLQEHSGRKLCDISPLLKKQLLHFSDKYLVSLSSTDSIIEAIRCGVELNIPVFGVDMEEFSTGHDNKTLIADIPVGSFDLNAYVMNNEKAAACSRDHYVDSRREKVMTARLASILSKHKKVLFTGGLAHWTMIKSLLSRPSVRPAEIMNSGKPPDITRVIIHPSMALMFMDTYPVLTTRYEENRKIIMNTKEQPSQLPDSGLVCREILRNIYDTYFSIFIQEQQEPGQVNESHLIPGFERMLAMYRLVRHKSAPSMADLLVVAQTMMPVDFNKILISRLMEIDRSWASPSEYPGLPMISYVPAEESKKCTNSSGGLFQITESSPGNVNQGPVCTKRSSPFSVRYNPGNGFSENLEAYWQWSNEPRLQCGSGEYRIWVWPPCEALLYGTANAAAKIAVSRLNEAEPYLFEGSLYEGLDVKTSMRSIIKGEKGIYIRKPSQSKKPFMPDSKKPDPTVFLFTSGDENADSRWSLMLGGLNIGDHVKNKARYNEVSQKLGSVFIATVAYDHYIEVPVQLQSHVSSMTMLEGTTIFGNPCINARQSAEWIEDNDYKCCPVLHNTGGGIITLSEYFLRLHNIEITTDNWQNALVQLAIPYARERVVIIAHSGFRVSRQLASEANRRKISLALTPLTYFPAEKITEMRRRVLVRALDSDGCRFSKDTEKVMGQKADHYRDLLPPYMQKQLNKFD